MIDNCEIYEEKHVWGLIKSKNWKVPILKLNFRAGEGVRKRVRKYGTRNAGNGNGDCERGNV